MEMLIAPEVLSREGADASQHFVNHHPQRIDIRPPIDLLATQSTRLLRRQVWSGAGHRAYPRPCLGFLQCRDAEVQDFDHWTVIIVCQEDVVRFDVAMNDLATMRGVERVADLPRNFDDLRRRHRSSAQSGG